MPSRGPALTFDPRYVTAAIDTWRTGDLAPIAPPDLERETARLMRERFIAWNIMGMHKQTVSAPAVTKAIGVFTALKLAKKTTKGSGEARATMLTTTAEGREILTDEPIGGALYPRFAECLSSASADISSLLDLLAVHGPLTQPILHLLPEAPRRGAAYQAAIKEGLLDFRRQATTTIITTPHITYEPANPRATPPQRIKAAQAWAAQTHPAGALKQLDKAVAISLAFGLLWVDVAQVNEVIGAKSVGLAAKKTARGYRPNIVSWPGDSGKLIPALISAVSTRANGSGFATIQEVRGALGRKLHLSPAAVDALLREVRDAGDRHEIPIELHFEPDEDQLAAIQRDPLIWREEAFEFITVLHTSRT
jgi:hypothetical protein